MRKFKLQFWAQISVFALGSLACDRGGEEAPEAESKAAAAKEEPAASAPEAKAEPEAEAPLPWAGRKKADSGFPCEVEEVLAKSCRRCHYEPQENDAPFPLVQWEDTQKVRSAKPIHLLMKQMVAAELMPPLDALVKPKVEPLSAEDKKTILDWLEAGGKKSDQVCK